MTCARDRICSPATTEKAKSFPEYDLDAKPHGSNKAGDDDRYHGLNV
jgi:hypothetical protein